MLLVLFICLFLITYFVLPWLECEQLTAPPTLSLSPTMSPSKGPTVSPTTQQPTNPPTKPQPSKSPSKSPSSSPSSSPTPPPTLPPTRSVSDGGRCRWLLCIFIVHRYIIFAHKICTISTFSLLSSSKCINSPRIVQVNLPHNSQLILQHNSQLVYVLRTQGQVCLLCT